MRTGSLLIINDGPSQPDLAALFIGAKTIGQALAMIDDARCNLYDMSFEVGGVSLSNAGPSTALEEMSILRNERQYSIELHRRAVYLPYTNCAIQRISV